MWFEIDRFLTKHNSSQPSASFRDNSSHFIDEFDLQSLKPGPGERISIDKYIPGLWDEVRRHYIQRGPCRPDINGNEYPQIRFETKMRRFCKAWLIKV